MWLKASAVGGISLKFILENTNTRSASDAVYYIASVAGAVIVLLVLVLLVLVMLVLLEVVVIVLFVLLVMS